jgi:hypothetical protein
VTSTFSSHKNTIASNSNKQMQQWNNYLHGREAFLKSYSERQGHSLRGKSPASYSGGPSLIPCGFCGGKSGTGTGFLRVFGFLCQFLFHQVLHTRLSTGTGPRGHLVADVKSGRSLTPPHETSYSQDPLVKLWKPKVYHRVYNNSDYTLFKPSLMHPHIHPF